MPLTFRLREVLHQEKKKWRSYAELSLQIKQANGGRNTLDRRKLKTLIEGGNVSLTVKDFEALDAYLEPLGEGLGNRALFEKEGLLQALTANGEVALIVGARPRANRQDVSNWDVKSMFRVFNEVQAVRPATRVHLHQDVSSGPEVSPALNRLLEPDGPSLCCIGSPRSCSFSEAVLARMFGVRPFVRPRAGHVNLPFYFVWVAGRRTSTQSSFALTVADIANRDEKQALQLRRNKACAFQASDMLYRVHVQAQEYKDYGILAVQRQPKGKVWMVIAGVSGPGTFSVADALDSKLTVSVSPSVGNDPGQTVYAVVEATVAVQKRKPAGDPREIKSQRIVVRPKGWAKP